MNANSIIYTLEALAFLIFTILSALSWKGKSTGLRLIIAAAVSSIWAAVIAINSLQSTLSYSSIWVVEMFKNIAWLWFVAGASRKILTPMTEKFSLWLIVSSLLLIPVFWVFPSERLGVMTPFMALCVAGIVFAAVMIGILWRMKRKARAEWIKSIQYLTIGLGAIFLFDLYFYSTAVFFQKIGDTQWMMRGLIGMMAVPFIVVATRYNYELSIEIFFSRHVVFYGVSFIAVGVYLLVMLFGGLYLRSVSSSWGAIAELIFFFIGGLGLLGIIFSTPIKRRIRVFISKHFFRHKYEYRDEWHRFINKLSTYGDMDVRFVALSAMADVMNSEKGLLFYLDGDENNFELIASCPKEFQMTGQNLISVHDEWIGFLRNRKWIVDFNELKKSPKLYDNTSFPIWMINDSQWRLLSPIFNLEKLVGFVLLSEPPPPFGFTYEDRDLLLTLGRHVSIHLAQHAAEKKLTEVGQFEAFNRLTAYMMHDLKNSAAQMSLLVKNSVKHKHNPDFIDDAILTVDGVVNRIERLIDQLRHSSVVEVNKRVILDKLLERVIESLSLEQPQPKLLIEDRGLSVDADLEQLSSVIGHLVKNAQEATSLEGRVELVQRRDKNHAVVVVSDDGCGMDEFFIRDQLFKPFYTTKGTRGMGIGAHQARDYIRSIGGNLLVESKVGIGTRMIVMLPLAEQHDQ